jgi:hypothetical protein
MDNPLHSNPQAEYDDDYDLVSDNSSIGSNIVEDDNFDLPADDDDDDTISFDMIDGPSPQPSPPTRQGAHSPLQPLLDLNNVPANESTTAFLVRLQMAMEPVGLAVAAYSNNVNSTLNPLFLMREPRQTLHTTERCPREKRKK